MDQPRLRPWSASLSEFELEGARRKLGSVPRTRLYSEILNPARERIRPTSVNARASLRVGASESHLRLAPAPQQAGPAATLGNLIAQTALLADRARQPDADS